MNWDGALRQAEDLVKKGGSLAWQWGDLMLACASNGREDIEKLHVEVGDAPSVATLINYRSVARAWPKSSRKQAAWEAHSILRTQQELLRDGMTGADARRARSQEKPVVPKVVASSSIERLMLARRWIRLSIRLADPRYKDEVAEAIVSIEEDLDRLREAYEIVREIV